MELCGNVRGKCKSVKKSEILEIGQQKFWSLGKRVVSLQP